MRKFTFLLAVVVAIGSMIASTPKTSLLFSNKKQMTQTDEVYSLNPSENKQVSLLKKKTAESLWKALSVESFEADPEIGGWMEESMIYTFTYDSKGNILTENDGFSLISYKYDENNKVIESIDQSILPEGGFENIERKVYEYDPIVTNLVINQVYYNWNANSQEWEANYNHKRDIVRNGDGKVLSVLLSLRDYQINEFIPLEKIEVELDESKGGVASKITFFAVSAETLLLEESNRLESIVWLVTDGQLVRPFDELMVGNNRVKSGTYFYNGTLYGTMKVEYDEEKPLSPEFDLTIASDDASEIERHTLTLLDENGSFKERITVLVDSVAQSDQYMICTYDSYKNIKEEAYFDNVDAPDTQIDGMRYEHTYLEDADKPGVVKETILNMFDGVDSYLPFMKQVYSNFVDVTLGLDKLSSANVSAHLNGGLLRFDATEGAVYKMYNINGQVVLQGVATSDKMSVSVADLSNGIYLLSVEGVGRAKLVK